MSRVPDECDFAAVPDLGHGMAEQPPKPHSLHLGQNRTERRATIGKGGLERMGLIEKIPPFGGPFFAFLHGNNVQTAPDQRIGDNMAVRRHPDAGNRVFVFDFDDRTPCNLPREERRILSIEAFARDRMETVGADHQIGFDGLPVLEPDHAALCDFNRFRIENDFDARLGTAFGKKIEKIGPMEKAVRLAPQLSQIEPCHRAPRECVHRHDGRGLDRPVIGRIRQSQGA